MKFTLKNYKLAKLKSLLKTQKLLFICHYINDKTNKYVKLNQKMSKKQLKFFKTDSSLVYFLLKKSIYLNLINLISGTVAILYFNKYHYFNDIFNINKKLNIFFFIFNKKFYPIKLIFHLSTIKYTPNINLLYFFFKNYIIFKFLPIFFLINKKLSRNNVI
jgi:ribosomal protein L10